jgi:hypothetical protein
MYRDAAMLRDGDGIWLQAGLTGAFHGAAD